MDSVLIQHRNFIKFLTKTWTFVQKSLRDFRIAGVVDNEKGAYWKPEYPDYPPGYPDKAPEGGKKGPKRVKDEENFKVINTEFEFCQELEFNPDEWCRFMLERLVDETLLCKFIFLFAFSVFLEIWQKNWMNFF